MSNEHLILCGGVDLTGAGGCWAKAKPLRLDTDPHHGNINLRISDISRAMVANLPNVAVDLLELAAYVYSADQAVKRGGAKEFEYGQRWRRRFRFEIPVREPEIWSQDRIVNQLTHTLGFLSDDDYEFAFTKLPHQPAVEQYLEFKEEGAGHPYVEEVLLFSGGLDSLGGAVQQILQARRKVALVSHRSVAKIGSKQEELVSALTGRVGDSNLEPLHVPVLINKATSLGIEHTQRSRSFLYASLAAVVARTFGLDRIRFYENGVMSLNLPICAQVLGARATRTTHPQVLRGFETLFGLLFECDFRVENPFLWKTKTDVLKEIKQAGHADLCKHTVSCMHTWEMTKLHTHCGRCSQCIDRRLSTLAAGFGDDEDPAEMYKNDVLTGPREQTEDITMVERYVGAANEIEAMHDAEQFCVRFPELDRVYNHVQGRVDQVAQGVYDLCKRHSQQVLGVIDDAGRRHVPAMRKGTLDPTCLISIACGSLARSDHAATDDDRYIFCRSGDGWLIRFDGKEGHFKKLNGFAYIHELIRRRREMGNDCKAISAIDLVRSNTLPERSAKSSRSMVSLEGLPTNKDEVDQKRGGGGAGPHLVMDDQALRDIKKAIDETKDNIAELCEQIENSPSEAEASRLRRDELEPENEKLAKLEEEKRRATGLGGKSRRIDTDNAQKARQSVRQAIKTAYKQLRSAQSPLNALADHLENSIPSATGCSFIYRPKPHFDWKLSN